MFNKPFWPLLTGAEGTVIFTGVTVARGKTLLLAAFGLCLGAIDVSVGPTESVILERRSQRLWFDFRWPIPINCASQHVDMYIQYVR